MVAKSAVHVMKEVLCLLCSFRLLRNQTACCYWYLRDRFTARPDRERWTEEFRTVLRDRFDALLLVWGGGSSSKSMSTSEGGVLRTSSSL